MKSERRFPWPALRQLSGDPLGTGAAVQSAKTKAWTSRTQGAKVVKSVCPFCAVGCGQKIYVKGERIIQIEGDEESPISRGRLCPKGAATRALTQSPQREYRVKYRRPYGTAWEELSLDRAMDMIADRVIKTRRETWLGEHEGKVVNHVNGIASLGGATLDNEENYLMKKLYCALGVVQVENQARL